MLNFALALTRRFHDGLAHAFYKEPALAKSGHSGREEVRNHLWCFQIAICIVPFFGLLALLRRDQISLGLPLAYLFLLLLNHVPGAYAHVVAKVFWTDRMRFHRNLFHRDRIGLFRCRSVVRPFWNVKSADRWFGI